MRLIDADALLDAISVHLERIEQEFDDAPTIDPVRYGRWLTEPYVGKHATLKVMRCSECDNPVLTLPSGKNYMFCPNCGARMDGDADDETD